MKIYGTNAAHKAYRVNNGANISLFLRLTKPKKLDTQQHIMYAAMKLFGIIGFPVSHSLSPKFFADAFTRKNINARYQFIEVANQNDLPEVLNALPKMGYFGCNITLPHKESAFNFISKNGIVSDVAKRIGAVNCIKYEGSTIVGTNTDAGGFAAMYAPSKSDNILILGAGGASRAVISACSNGNVIIANRSIEKAQNFAKEFACQFLEERMEDIDLSKFDAIINTTSVGLADETLQLRYDTLHHNTQCIDIIYKETPFLQIAKSKGCKTQNGTKMFEEQAKKSFEFWFGEAF